MGGVTGRSTDAEDEESASTFAHLGQPRGTSLDLGRVDPSNDLHRFTQVQLRESFSVIRHVPALDLKFEAAVPHAGGIEQQYEAERLKAHDHEE